MVFIHILAKLSVVVLIVKMKCVFHYKWCLNTHLHAYILHTYSLSYCHVNIGLMDRVEKSYFFCFRPLQDCRKSCGRPALQPVLLPAPVVTAVVTAVDRLCLKGHRSLQRSLHRPTGRRLLVLQCNPVVTPVVIPVDRHQVFLKSDSTREPFWPNLYIT